MITGLFAVLAAYIALSGADDETPDVDATVQAILGTATPDPERIASQGVTSNAEWENLVGEDGYVREFDGAEMVLVPAGCFMMGSGDIGSNGRPAHEICFDDPFWIDKYEVTNEQYGSVGCESSSSEPDQPRNCVNWFDSSDFCEALGGRLPTEAEWEYAARGPDSLVYSWGNEWNPDNANWADTSPDETFPVGSFLQAASWVGAMDMSGNLWEWTSSLYEDYPYDQADGREDIDDRSSVRVVRGGSFRVTSNLLRAAYRGFRDPYYDFDVVGFRCMRPFSQ